LPSSNFKQNKKTNYLYLHLLILFFVVNSTAVAPLQVIVMDV